VNRDQFLKQVRKFAKANQLEFRLDKKRGKGSHITVYLDDKSTVIPSGELKKGTLISIKKKLKMT